MMKTTHASEDRTDMEYELPKLFNKTKAFIKEDACKKFCDETRHLYLKRDAS